MRKKFFTSLRESPFIEGMGRILDFAGIIGGESIPAKSDAEALGDDWETIMKDFHYTLLIVKENGHGSKENQQQ
jgi:hypothetical protein